MSNPDIETFTDIRLHIQRNNERQSFYISVTGIDKKTAKRKQIHSSDVSMMDALNSDGTDFTMRVDNVMLARIKL